MDAGTILRVALSLLVFINFANSTTAYIVQFYNYTENNTPIIGVLSQELTSFLKGKLSGNYQSYIAASYVKFIESAGARVVPIWIGREREYYENIMSKINGVLFPGGSSSFETSKGYAEAGSYIYDIAIDLNEKGEYFPLWGTCLGFELLYFLSTNKTDIRAPCNSQSQTLHLEFKSDYYLSRMFENAPKSVTQILSNEPVTSNFHKFCYTEKNVTKYGLDDVWKTISLNEDTNGFRFISSSEHKKYPFYGVQFHPEKNIFEWVINRNISHTFNAIIANRYFSDFFINEARKSNQKFFNLTEERKYLIYNFHPNYTGLSGSVFEQCYLF